MTPPEKFDEPLRSSSFEFDCLHVCNHQSHPLEEEAPPAEVAAANPDHPFFGVVDSPTVAACLPQIKRGWLENHPFHDFPRKASTF